MVSIECDSGDDDDDDDDNNSVSCSIDDIPLVANSSSRRSGYQPIRPGTVQRAEAHTSRMVGISRF